MHFLTARSDACIKVSENTKLETFTSRKKKYITKNRNLYNWIMKCVSNNKIKLTPHTHTCSQSSNTNFLPCVHWQISANQKTQKYIVRTVYIQPASQPVSQRAHYVNYHCTSLITRTITMLNWLAFGYTNRISLTVIRFVL